MTIKNFGQNVEISPVVRYSPRTEQEVLDILNRHKGERIRCVGRLHSWSRVLEAEGVLLDLRHLNDVQCDSIQGEPVAHVGAGCQVKNLLAELERQRQWTLPTVGFITEQSIVGAISTGTHGSGRHSLSHYVTQVRIAQYDRNSGEAVIVTVSDGDILKAARCSLGCLGVIVGVTMRCRTPYRVEELFRQHERIEQVLAAEEQFPLQQCYLVPWKWVWFAQHRVETSAPTSRMLKLYLWYRYIVFDLAMHLLILCVVRLLRWPSVIRATFRRVIPAFVIQNWSVVGPSTQQLVMEHELFRHIELELFVRRDQLPDAMKFLQDTLLMAGQASSPPNPEFLALVDQAGSSAQGALLRGTYCHHYPICVRRILPDETLISMASDDRCSESGAAAAVGEKLKDNGSWYSITMTNYHRGSARRPFLTVCEFLTITMSRLFGARPHWGKLCLLSPAMLRRLYPSFDAFRNICNVADPQSVFRNDWMRELLNSQQVDE